MYLVITFATFLIIGSQAANILYLSGVPTTSHFIWNRALINGLAANGHNITVLSADLDEKAPPNVHYLHLDQAYPELEKAFADLSEADDGIYNGIKIVYDWCYAASVGFTVSKGFKTLLSYPDNFKFDLVINDFTCGAYQNIIADKCRP